MQGLIVLYDSAFFMESTLQLGVHNSDSLCDDRREFAGYVSRDGCYAFKRG